MPFTKSVSQKGVTMKNMKLLPKIGSTYSVKPFLRYTFLNGMEKKVQFTDVYANPIQDGSLSKLDDILDRV